MLWTFLRFNYFIIPLVEENETLFPKTFNTKTLLTEENNFKVFVSYSIIGTMFLS